MFTFILLQTPTGRFYLAQESKLGADPLSTTDVSVAVRNNSIYVSLAAERGIWARHQFKSYDGTWRLIGLFNHNFSDSDDHDNGTGAEVDLNLLTGDLIVTPIRLRGGELQKTPGKKDKATGNRCVLADYTFAYSFCVHTWKTQAGQSMEDFMWSHR